MVDMTTISVKEDVKEELLKFASKLQIELKRRVDYNEAIRYLLMRRQRRPRLVEEACTPLPGAEKARRTLVEERKRDEERAERSLCP